MQRNEKDVEERVSNRRQFAVYITAWCVFCITVIVKMALSTTMPAILGEQVLNKVQISSIISAYWIVYAVGQPFGGVLADKLRGEVLLCIVLICSAVLCVIFAMFDSYLVKMICWAGIGLAQFTAWPSVAVLTSKYVSGDMLGKAVTYLAFPYPVGNILSYGLSAAILLKLSWKYVFIIDAIICILMLVVLITVIFRCIYPLKKLAISKSDLTKKTIIQEKKKVDYPYLLKNGLISVCVISFFRSMLYTGITTWIPVMFYETKEISNSLSLLFTVFIQLASVFAIFPADALLRANKNNEFKTSNIMIIFSMIFFVLLLFYKEISMWIMMISFMVIIGVSCTIGTVVVLQRVPYRYQKYDAVGLVSGLTNGFASFGNVVSIYGYGILIEKTGWSGIAWLWLILAALMLSCTLTGTKKWTAFIMKK